jgi:hypothetical protein
MGGGYQFLLLVPSDLWYFCDPNPGGEDMKRTLALLVACALLMMAGPLSAHHSTAMYAGSKTVTGKVLKFEWTNPHAHVYIETKDEQNRGLGLRNDEPESPQVLRLDFQDRESRGCDLRDRRLREKR